MITFNASFYEDNRVERYCLHSLNTACPKDSCIPAGGGYYTCDGLEAGVEYNFTVRAVNCGNQESTETDVIIIAPQGKLSLLLTISSRLALIQCCHVRLHSSVKVAYSQLNRLRLVHKFARVFFKDDGRTIIADGAAVTLLGQMIHP